MLAANLRLLVFLTASSAVIAQRLPGLGSDPLNKPDVRPPIVTRQPEVKRDPAVSHRKALADLEQLAREAQSLREEMKKSGPAVISGSWTARAEKIERLAKRVRSSLKTN